MFASWRVQATRDILVEKVESRAGHNQSHEKLRGESGGSRLDTCEQSTCWLEAD